MSQCDLSMSADISAHVAMPAAIACRESLPSTCRDSLPSTLHCCKMSHAVLTGQGPLEWLCRVVPHLSLLRGTNWEAKHWQSLLALLGLSRKSKDTLLLCDLLKAADAISSNVDKIRSLDAQAQSEGIIRKALDELDLWGFQRKFSLLQGKDSSGSSVRIPAASAGFSCNAIL